MSYETNIAEIKQCYANGLTTSGQCANQLVEEVMTGVSSNVMTYKMTCKFINKTITAGEYISHFYEGSF